VSDKCCIMSDMPSDRITIRVPQALGQRLRSRSRLKGLAESELVREALESYLGQSTGERPAFELAEEAGLIGCVRRALKDLSTDSRHFEGFGMHKSAKTRARKKL
jgi:predicted DNA-binding protein